MNNRVANFLSVAFHPLLIPTFLLGVLYLFAPSVVGFDVIGAKGSSYLIGFVFVTTFVMPSFLIYYLYKFGFVKSITLERLSDRRIPYLTSTFVYACVTYFFVNGQNPIAQVAPNIGVLMASATFSILLTALISLRWQISAHATGVGGLTGITATFLIFNGVDTLLMPLAGCILLSGAVISARLSLQAHTPLQTIAGFLLGLIVSILTLTLLT